jgi:hypothetical protein
MYIYVTAFYQKPYAALCSFEDSVCVVCEYECLSHTGGTPSCTEPAKCDICSAYHGELAEHDFTEWISAVEPECEKNGAVGHYLCNTCANAFDENKNQITDVNINATGHSLGVLVPKKEPTCVEPGYAEHYLCANCQALFDREKLRIDSAWIAPLGHIFDAPTCITASVCQRCDSICQQPDPDNHIHMMSNFDENHHWMECECGAIQDKCKHLYTKTVIKEATESEEGILEYSCTCGYAYEKSIPCIKNNAPQEPINNTLKATPIIIVIISGAILIAASVAVILTVKKKKK